MWKFGAYANIPLWIIVIAGCVLLFIEICKSKPIDRKVFNSCDEILLRDEPSIEDNNKRAGYARTIVEAIKADVVQENHAINDAYTINIDDRFGQGKTSFFLQIKKFLDEDSILYCDFAPWRDVDNRTMTEVLFDELINVLKPYFSIKEIRIIREYVAMIVKDHASIHVVTKFVDDIMRKKHAMSSFYEEIEKDLLKLKQPIVIFIDDVDRLRHDELWQLCSLIRDSANFPYLYFITAADIDYVSMTMADRKISKDETERYLLKIINLDLQLPKASMMFNEKYVKNQITSILKSANFDSEVIESTIDVLFNRNNVINANIMSLFPDLRETKRFFSMLRIDMAARKISKEKETQDDFLNDVDLLDYLRIELIKHFDRNLYRTLRDRPYQTLSINNQLYEIPGQLASNITEDFGKPIIGNQSKDNHPKETKDTIQSTAQISKVYIEMLLFQMFAPLSFVAEWSSRIPKININPSNNSIRRSCCYDNYFTYEVYEGNITYSQFIYILDADEETFSKEIVGMNEEKKIYSFYGQLYSFVSDPKSFNEYSGERLFKRIFYCIGITAKAGKGQSEYFKIKDELNARIPIHVLIDYEKDKKKGDNQGNNEIKNLYKIKDVKKLRTYICEDKEFILLKIALLALLKEMQTSNILFETILDDSDACKFYSTFLSCDDIKDIVLKNESYQLFNDLRSLNEKMWIQLFSEFLKDKLDISSPLIAVKAYTTNNAGQNVYDGKYLTSLFGNDYPIIFKEVEKVVLEKKKQSLASKEE